MLSYAELLCFLLLMCCAEHCGVALRSATLCRVVLFCVELRWIMVLCYIARRNRLILTHDGCYGSCMLQQGSIPVAQCTSLPGPSRSGKEWSYSGVECKNSHGSSERKTWKKRVKETM